MNIRMETLRERLAKYVLPQQYMEQDLYPYFREIEGKQGTEVEMGGHKVLMFGSNAYTLSKLVYRPCANMALGVQAQDF